MTCEAFDQLLAKHPRRALKPWSPIEDGVLILAINPTVRVAETNRMNCCVLNESGGLIWSLCDGERSVGDIAAVVSSKYDLPAMQARADVIKVILDLEAANLMILGDNDFF